MAAEVEDHITREEEQMDEESPWRKNPSEVPAGLYHKKFELAKGYLNAYEACRLEDYHVHYRCYQCDQLIS